MTSVQTQQFVGGVEPGVGQDPGVLPEPPEQEGRVPGQVGGGTHATPPHVRRLVDHAVGRVELRLGNGLVH